MSKYFLKTGRNSLLAFAVTMMLLLMTITTLTVQPVHGSAQTRIYVNPPEYYARRINEVFTVDVNIENVDLNSRLIGVDFTLQYNATLLEVLNVTEGSFLKGFGDTYFLRANDIPPYNLEEVGIYLLPLENGTRLRFPEGNGTLSTITFKVIHSPPGSCELKLYDTILIDVDLVDIPHTVSHGYYELFEIQPIDVEVDVGETHFRGEIAEFYVLTSYMGDRVDASSVSALLYKPDGSVETLDVERIATGFYKVIYAIPGNASTGKYALLVEARYTMTIDLKTVETSGTSFGCFLLSPTLTNMDATIEDIEGEIATVVIPNLGAIRANLTAINAELVSIDWETGIATIQTSLGTIKGYVENVDDGGLAILKGTQESFVIPQYATLVLALIAAIAAILLVILVRRKPTH